MADTSDEVLAAIKLTTLVIALLSGQKSAAEVDAELKAGMATNNDWLAKHGFPTVPPSV